MQISRRDFLRYTSASVLALGLSELDLTRVQKAFAQSNGAPPVLWLHGAACTGCSVSLLNAVNPTIDQLLINTIRLKYHPTLMTAAGDLAVAQARSTESNGGYILVVEGAIPTANGGKYCYVWDEGGRAVTMAEAVRSLATQAKYIVAVGTCAAFGGIPAVNSATGAMSVSAFLGKPVVNLPGCPAHPDWIIGTLAQVIGGQMPPLDSYSRPVAYYTPDVIHHRCPRRETEEASRFGQPGRCLEELGCKGPRTHADCDLRWWNNKQNWCIGADALCIGCTEPNFPAFPLHGGEGDGGGDD